MNLAVELNVKATTKKMELVKELKAFGTKVSTKLFLGDH